MGLIFVRCSVRSCIIMIDNVHAKFVLGGEGVNTSLQTCKMDTVTELTENVFNENGEN